MVITVRGLKMFEKKLTAQMMIEAIQFDNPKMFDRSGTLFFKYFLIRCYLSVRVFIFCAVGEKKDFKNYTYGI